MMRAGKNASHLASSRNTRGIRPAVPLLAWISADVFNHLAEGYQEGSMVNIGGIDRYQRSSTLHLVLRLRGGQ